MKERWRTLSVAAVLCLAVLAGTARAQERPAPAPEPEQIGEGGDVQSKRHGISCEGNVGCVLLRAYGAGWTSSL